MNREDREHPAPRDRDRSPAQKVTQEAPPPVPPCIVVIFGASGDLTRRKLVPALCNLRQGGLLPDEFAVLGVARQAMTDEEYRERMGKDLEVCDDPQDPAHQRWLLDRLHYLVADVEDDESYRRLAERLAELDEQHGTPGSYLYYMATAPQLFSTIIMHLGMAGLVEENDGRFRRVVIEKPFGSDLESARTLNREIGRVIDERQTYRIDHYLGKETVQNIIAFRFGNGIFEPIWNRRYIDHVQITASETVGVEGRGGYYDTSGALRDMVPNHLFQLISLTAMEPPISFQANAVRDEQAKVLQAIAPFTHEDVLRRTVRGQYGEGRVANQRRAAYRNEPRVDPESTTETFVALKLYLDNWRWADVPFYLRTGKSLKRRETRITIEFKQPPFMLFRDTPVEHLQANRLVIDIQPDEAISLRFGAKIPGPQLRLGGVDMRFAYKDYFGERPSTGYERLLYDCMVGDATLFQRLDMVESGWAVVAPVLDVWKALPPRDFPNYASGSWGPKEADDLMTRSGRAWMD